MFGEYSFDESRLEVAALARAPREQDVREEVAKIAPEPGAYRNREALLAARQNLLGQPLGGRLLQDVLPTAVAHLQVGRQARGEIDDFVVEQRHT